jgi:hypothetical protein
MRVRPTWLSRSITVAVFSVHLFTPLSQWAGGPFRPAATATPPYITKGSIYLYIYQHFTCWPAVYVQRGWLQDDVSVESIALVPLCQWLQVWLQSVFTSL